jgi:D-beta-D-heptose 7-phosphate kinase/D-beta-D-heptose 1-phosphate adenosyltransferase
MQETSNKTQWIQNKIIDRKDLLHKANMWRASGKKIVFTNGCFDILHHGHLAYLAEAASQGNILIVGVNSDASVKRLKGNERPLTHEKDRAFQIASLLVTDAVTVFDEDTPKELIELIKPDVLVKGGDYTIDKIVGADVVIAQGGNVVIVPFVNGYSTTSIIEFIKKL